MSFFSNILLRTRWTLNSYADAGSLIRHMHMVPLVRERAIETDAKQILDAGCGSGVFAFTLAKHLPQKVVVGLDVDPNYYHQCLTKKEHFHRYNTRFTLSSLTQPLGEGLYDIVYSVDVLEHIADDGMALRNIHASLKLEGYLILHVPRARPTHVFRITDKLADEIGQRAHHVRDGYEPSPLCSQVEEAGFEVTNVYSTFAKCRGGLAWEIYTILMNRIILLPLALLYKLTAKLRFSKEVPLAPPRWYVLTEKVARSAFGNLYIPIGLLFGFFDIAARDSNQDGQGILLVARKKP